MQHRDYFEKEVRTVLCVRDLERSRNFYQQTLELVPVWDGGMEGCRFAAAGGAVELRPSGTNLPQGPTTIMLEADNVDDCYSRLAKKPGLLFMNISRTARMGSGCSSCSIQMKT